MTLTQPGHNSSVRRSQYVILCIKEAKYALLGALRTTAQLISYEVVIGLMVIMVVMVTGSLNLISIIEAQGCIWNIIPIVPIFII